MKTESNAVEGRYGKESLARENRLIALANRLLELFVSETGKILYDKVLDVVLEGMESKHGVFGYIDEVGDLVCPTMSRLLDSCEIEGKCMRYAQGTWKGLWSKALLGHRALYSNEPSAIPTGHVPIRRHIAVPIMFQGNPIGLFNIANKEADYTEEDRRFIEAVAKRIAPLLYAWIQRELRDEERKAAEKALRHSEQRLSRAQDLAHLGSWELDLERNELSWSDEVYRIFGLQPQEFGASYEAFLEAVHPDDRAAVDAAYSGSLREGRDSYEIEHRIVRKSTGEIRIVQEKCEQIRDGTGRIIRSMGMVHDITERKRAEEETLRTNERLRILSDTASALLVSENPQAVIQTLAMRVMKHLDCHAFFNYLSDEEARRLHLNACAGIPEYTAREIKWLDYGVAICGFVAREGCSMVAEDIMYTPDERTALVRSLGIQAYACNPLLSEGGRVIGTLSFGTRTRTKFAADELDLMKAVTDMVATALWRIRLIEAERKLLARERHIAEVLQQAIVPSRIPEEIGGYRFAARYQPAMEEADVGGDFFDIFDLGGGRAGILMGDVAGKGLAAAIRVAEARYSIRCYAYLDPRPARVLALANDALNCDRAEGMLTAVFAVLDTRVGMLTYSRAGHEPMLVVGPDGKSEALLTGDPPLGIIKNLHYSEGTYIIKAGERVVIMTDGITEARGASACLFGSEGVLKCMNEYLLRPIDDAASALVEAAMAHAPGRIRDDMAVILIEQG